MNILNKYSFTKQNNYPDFPEFNPPHTIFPSKELVDIYTDGSYKDFIGKIGAITLSNGTIHSQYSYILSDSCSSSTEVELICQALLLKSYKHTKHINFFIDNMAVIIICNTLLLPSPPKEYFQSKNPLSPWIKLTLHLLSKRKSRNLSTSYQHVHSHLINHHNDLNKKTLISLGKDTFFSRIQKMKESFSDRLLERLIGNH